MKIVSGSNYTIYIPDRPTRAVVYLNAHIAFPSSNGRPSRTKYNFREEVADAIYNDETVAIVGLYNKKLLEIILDVIVGYHIPRVIVSGWSAGGNDALTVASYLNGFVYDLKVLLIDSNHTNNVSNEVFKKLKGVPISDVSNNLNKVKIKKLQKVIDNGLFNEYLLLTIPKSFKGSHHRYCRDSTLENHLYDYISGGFIDPSQYSIWQWDPIKKEMVPKCP